MRIDSNAISKDIFLSTRSIKSAKNTNRANESSTASARKPDAQKNDLATSNLKNARQTASRPERLPVTTKSLDTGRIPVNHKTHKPRPGTAVNLAKPLPTSTSTTEETTNDGEKSQKLTLDGLLKAWGQKDTPYDLNHDGTVNTDDLLQFINSLPVPQPPSSPPAARPEDPSSAHVDGVTTTPPEQKPQAPIALSQNHEEDHEGLTMDGLLKAWGQKDSPYDLNHDGTVNTDDLLSFIHGLPAPPLPGQEKPLNGGSASANSQSVVPNPANSNNSAAKPNLTMDGLLKAWGQHDSPYDLTGDGNVNVDDLLSFINHFPAQWDPKLGIHVT